jgi:AcrR family transcriptional regulator
MDVNEILLIFSQYGFRNASMEDLAKAAGMSRQGLYKRFGSKDRVFEGAILTFMERSLNEALEQLAQPDQSPKEAICATFQIWIGKHVPLLHGTPHGMEIMDRAIGIALSGGQDYEGRLYQALADYCVKNSLVTRPELAQDWVFTLSMASKGLMLKTITTEEFATGMKRIVNMLLSDL